MVCVWLGKNQFRFSSDMEELLTQLPVTGVTTLWKVFMLYCVLCFTSIRHIILWAFPRVLNLDQPNGTLQNTFNNSKKKKSMFFLPYFIPVRTKNCGKFQGTPSVNIHGFSFSPILFKNSAGSPHCVITIWIFLLLHTTYIVDCRLYSRVLI